MNYYPFHIGDYASATRHLSWDEDAAYRRLLDVYYTHEKPLPADHRAVCRLVLATTEAQRDAVKVVLEEFWELTDAGWVNHRADAEIHAMQEKQQKQRDKANKRWHKQREEPGIAPAMPQHEGVDAAASDDSCRGNATNTNTNTNSNTNTKVNPHSPQRGVGVDDLLFAKFWEAFPKKVGKDAARKAWDRIKQPTATLKSILEALAWQNTSEQWTKEGGRFIPNPATYLNQGRWNDQPTKVSSAARLTPVGRRSEEAANRWLETHGLKEAQA